VNISFVAPLPPPLQKKKKGGIESPELFHQRGEKKKKRRGRGRKKGGKRSPRRPGPRMYAATNSYNIPYLLERKKKEGKEGGRRNRGAPRELYVFVPRPYFTKTQGKKKRREEKKKRRRRKERM